MRLDLLYAVYRDGLLDDTLPFWLDRCVDYQHGGFMMCLDQDGSIVDTDKGIWQQCRFTWLLAKLYNCLDRDPRWLDLAQHGIKFVDNYCIDSADGRMWFHVTRDGRPIRKRRYAFTESFAAIAYGEVAKGTGKQEYADKARHFFDRFVNHQILFPEAETKFTNTRPAISIGYPMITIGTAQELRESIDFQAANRWIDRSIETIQKLFVKPDLQCVMETVSPNGDIIDHFDGRTLNPGHAIEAAWFIMREGKFRVDNDLIHLGTTMLDWMWQRGWDREYGGVLNLVDVNGLPVQEYWHDMKFWWPHNETIIATLLAYQLTGDEKYAEMHQLVHDWAYDHFVDRELGEWFGYLHRDGSISSTLKGNIWKGPFHLPRMQLVCSQIIDELRQQRITSPIE